ncbi:chemotaxis protein CheB [Rugamonas sp.]|uniref:chemotaxis protein CheB n=1 Tax=Rugamonas sp. TaxID=1926287 RepID=UPI0025ECF5E4|nr:chemotaxis protein CheB [Rugamonas sp.]
MATHPDEDPARDRATGAAAQADVPALRAALAGRRFDAVVIGASAGGVGALLEILPALPAGYDRAVVAALHLPAGRQSQLAEVFRVRMALPVAEAQDKQPVDAGHVYFAGADYHLSIETDQTFSLSCEAPLHFARPAIDFLMTSAADAYGPRLLGILLTGANQDGAAGLAAIHRRGGMTVVQDPAEAAAPTMPREAIRLDRPDLILPLAAIRALLLMLT